MAKTEKDVSREIAFSNVLAGIEIAERIIKQKRPSPDQWSDNSEYTEKRICNDLLEELQKEKKKYGG